MTTPPPVPEVGDEALARCADEPIAIPGAVQPYGALLAGAVAIAGAGHLPVLLAMAGGADLLHEGHGPALGVLDDADYPETRLDLAGDDRLLLFSDGLVERRGVPLEDRLDALRAAVAAGRDPETLLDDVLAALDPPDTDDVTLVGLGRT